MSAGELKYTNVSPADYAFCASRYGYDAAGNRVTGGSCLFRR